MQQVLGSSICSEQGSGSAAGRDETAKRRVLTAEMLLLYCRAGRAEGVAGGTRTALYAWCVTDATANEGRLGWG